MNSLSWFIYAIDIIGNIKGFLIALMIASVVVLGIRIGATVAGNDINNTKNPYPPYRAVVAFVVVGGIIASLLPAKGTLYAIAASEVGERVINTETVKGMSADATKALQQWIKRQIEPETNKK